MTSIAVLGGTGQQGSGLARRFARAGARVIVGSRDPDRARATAADWGAMPEQVEVATNAAAAAQANVDCARGPVRHRRRVARRGALELEERRRGDRRHGAGDVRRQERWRCWTSPKDPRPSTFALVCRPRSGWRPRSRPFPRTCSERAMQPLDCDEFVCGDSDEARARAVELVSMLPGLRAVDVGPLSRARSIEHLTALAIADQPSSQDPRCAIPDRRINMKG